MNVCVASLGEEPREMNMCVASLSGEPREINVCCISQRGAERNKCVFHHSVRSQCRHLAAIVSRLFPVCV